MAERVKRAHEPPADHFHGLRSKLKTARHFGNRKICSSPSKLDIETKRTASALTLSGHADHWLQLPGGRAARRANLATLISRTESLTIAV